MNTKRIIALLLCAVMLLSMIPVMAISTAAATDGIWTTYRFAGEYPDPDEEEDPNEEPTIYKPEAGYEYTSEGFSVIGADYKNTTPSLTVITKEKQDIKDGIYLQFRIDDYSYDGGTGADQWICLSLTTGEKVAPGSTSYGGGWLTLVRGIGDGNCSMLPHLTDPKTEDFGGTFNNIGIVNGSAPMDEEGREIYTLEVTWTGSEYEIKVNGVVQPGAAQATALLEKLDSNGQFYVGVNMQAGVKNGTAAITVLKYGTSEADATKPVGDDSKQPEENQMEIAEIQDPTTIPANQPAMLWTPETYNIKGGNNCTFTALGDNTWRVTATDSLVFFNFNPKRSWSWDAVDFPVFGIMVKNLWVDGGTVWYAAGEVTGAQNDCTFPMSVYDGEFYGEDEDYIFIPVDLTDLWEGRINTIRLDLTLSDEATREFDILFAGMFRTVEEGIAYANGYMENLGVGAAPTEEETTEAPTEPTDEETTAAPADGETTAAPADGETTAATNDTTAPTEEKGCGAVVGFGAVAVLAAAAAAVALKKKD